MMILDTIIKEFRLHNSGRDENRSASRPATAHDLYLLECRLDAKLLLLFEALCQLQQIEIHMATTLDDVLGEVQDESTVDDSIIALLTGIKAQLDAAGGDKAKIDAIFSGLQANKAKLAAAIVANTPAAPTP